MAWSINIFFGYLSSRFKNGALLALGIKHSIGGLGF
jgi:hypothetical protein